MKHFIGYNKNNKETVKRLKNIYVLNCLRVQLSRRIEIFQTRFYGC